MPLAVAIGISLAGVGLWAGLWADRKAVQARLRLPCPVCRKEVEAEGKRCPHCATELITTELALEVMLAVRERDDRRARYARWSLSLIVASLFLLIVALLVEIYIPAWR